MLRAELLSVSADNQAGAQLRRPGCPASASTLWEESILAPDLGRRAQHARRQHRRPEAVVDLQAGSKCVTASGVEPCDGMQAMIPGWTSAGAGLRHGAAPQSSIA